MNNEEKQKLIYYFLFVTNTKIIFKANNSNVNRKPRFTTYQYHFYKRK